MVEKTNYGWKVVYNNKKLPLLLGEPFRETYEICKMCFRKNEILFEKSISNMSSIIEKQDDRVNVITKRITRNTTKLTENSSVSCGRNRALVLIDCFSLLNKLYNEGCSECNNLCDLKLTSTKFNMNSCLL